MAPKDLSLGLSISGNRIQAVEIERGGTSGILLAIDEWQNRFPFDDGASNDSPASREFQEYLQAFIKVNRVKATQVSVALDTALLFLNTLPVEDGLPRTRINELIEWELHQYFPDIQPKEFITDVHVMSTHREQGWNEMLAVSIRRRHTLAVKEALKNLGLTLHIVDVDHFNASFKKRISNHNRAGL